MNKRAVGKEYEQQAAEYLQRQGFQILEQNFRSRFGEIDIVAKEGETLCFVEVKYRSGRDCGSPQEAVDRRKRRKISRMARFYLAKHGYDEWSPCRFDVVAMEPGQIELFRNAFEYCP